MTRRILESVEFFSRIGGRLRVVELTQCYKTFYRRKFTSVRNKLWYLSLTSHYSLVCGKVKTPGLTHKHQTRLERLFRKFITKICKKTDRKKFYNIGTWTRYVVSTDLGIPRNPPLGCLGSQMSSPGMRSNSLLLSIL